MTNHQIESAYARLAKSAGYFREGKPLSKDTIRIFDENLSQLAKAIEEAPDAGTTDAPARIEYRTRLVEVESLALQKKVSELETQVREQTNRRMGWEDREGLRLRSQMEARHKWPELY